jgi:hypothetical protein
LFTPELYQQAVLGTMPRVFNLLDRNPCSITYGCFDRSYWHHRKTDFPVSTAQMLMGVLAQLYAKDFRGNVYYQSSVLLEWIKASLNFAISIQHKDGSFDEWYPNERGWAGPTGYMAHSICETLDHIESKLDSEQLKKIHDALLRAAEHLNIRDEKDILANHYAISILPLFEISQKTNSKEVFQMYLNWKKKFLKLQTTEGWFLEYDGCDLGYTLGTLDFLASLHKKNSDPEISEAACSALSFLAYFAYPDGSWAGSLGSRHTNHSYPFALEYWSKFSESAKALLGHYRQGFTDQKTLLPSDQEDHYLAYRLKDYLKAAEEFFPLPTGLKLPYEDRSFRGISFPKAKFEIVSSDTYWAWIACGRGGAIKVFEKKQKKLLYANCGVQLIDSQGRSFSSLWQGSDYTFTEDQMIIYGTLEPVFQKRFRPVTFILFRIACLIIPNKKLAYYFKVLIRKVLITHNRRSPFKWKRELKFLSNEIQGSDSINDSNVDRASKIYWGGEFHSRYVPQGNYFTSPELRFSPKLVDRNGSSEVKFDFLVSTKPEKVEECAKQMEV